MPSLCTVDHSLKSCATDIRAIQDSHLRDGDLILFVEPPGFDNPDMLDVEIVSKVADWLVKTYVDRMTWPVLTLIAT
jgi:hypothetical protein